MKTTGSTFEHTAEACAKRCIQESLCGYFAWGRKRTYDGNNCKLYQNTGECTDEGNYADLNLYKMRHRAPRLVCEDSSTYKTKWGYCPSYGKGKLNNNYCHNDRDTNGG